MNSIKKVLIVMEIENLLLFTKKKSSLLKKFGVINEKKPDFKDNRYEIYERPYLKELMHFLLKVKIKRIIRIFTNWVFGHLYQEKIVFIYHNTF